MKRYNFRLQRVLDIKNIKQKIRERELAKSLTSLEMEKHTLEEQKTRRQVCQSEIRDRKRTTAFEMRVYSKYFAFLQDEIDNQSKRVIRCINEVDNKKKNLTNAYKEKKVLENLKVKTKQEYGRECDKEEQRENDEVSLGMFVKKITHKSCKENESIN